MPTPDFSHFRVSDDGQALRILDQRRLPTEEVWLELGDVEAVALAIERLAVRGAPAIGCVAALGFAVASHGFADDPARFRDQARAGLARLADTRPTAVNLFVALRELEQTLAACDATAGASMMRQALSQCARDHVTADLQACDRLARLGAELLPSEGGVLTHCNAGALATGGIGTALGVLLRGRELGKRFVVFADETRPVLQGARLTAWELERAGVPVQVIADNMAGALMAHGLIQAAVVGADRIARNGDVANKIGTYSVAVLCRYHGIPLYVAAPWTTVDLALASGAEIPIEERDASEVRHHGGRLMTPPQVAVRNPAFDVTPAQLVTKIITERGVCTPQQLAHLQPSWS
ncbi:MAG: S-methyl-5-thioribose-1-phosphate isomerase [Myxococcales bacterium FL481]|nr:MAG: S-methyl-5-thioribose-1-phosphate isomerase [Myxococcales bacterium FL481]